MTKAIFEIMQLLYGSKKVFKTQGHLCKGILAYEGYDINGDNKIFFIKIMIFCPIETVFQTLFFNSYLMIVYV